MGFAEWQLLQHVVRCLAAVKFLRGGLIMVVPF